MLQSEKDISEFASEKSVEFVIPTKYDSQKSSE